MQLIQRGNIRPPWFDPITCEVPAAIDKPVSISAKTRATPSCSRVVPEGPLVRGLFFSDASSTTHVCVFPGIPQGRRSISLAFVHSGSFAR